MKTNLFSYALLVLLAVAVQLPAPEPVSSSDTNAPRLPVIQEFPLSDSTNSESALIDTNAEAQLFKESKAKAEKGNAKAQFDLGFRYYSGIDGETNAVEAVNWWRKAAEQGLAEAQSYLGHCYENGEGVKKDVAEAAKWYRKAAEQNDALSQLSLGGCYYGGTGVEKDVAEAAKWYGKAATQGLAGAQGLLGSFYANGEGVTQDYSEALKWYRKAANQGDDFAQNNLGSMYANGRGVPQDYVEAYKWYNLAAAQGNTTAIDNRDGIVRHMMPSQVAEAQRLSREFVPQNETTSKFSPPQPDETVASPAEPTATGTGFFITDDGYLISNYHVVKDAAQVRLLTRAGKIPAKVVQVDEANDIALLKADGKFAPLPITSSRTVKLGGTVATVGFPDTGLQGFAPKLAKGEIASLSGVQDDPRQFQISVPLQPGNSGGALVDERGNVVGIVSAKLSAQAALDATGALPENVNYAVKSSFILGFLESMPDVSAKLKEPNSQDEKFEDVVKSAQSAAVLVLVY
jgi:TPR repeat protein